MPASALPAFVEPLDSGVYCIDTGFTRPRFDAAYLLVDQGRAAFIDTGTMDIFHDEDAAFADLLRAAGVDVEFHVWNGAPHGFDYVAGRSGLAKRAWKARFDFLQRHLQG
jgi:acetyl esterase/lipase